MLPITAKTQKWDMAVLFSKQVALITHWSGAKFSAGLRWASKEDEWLYRPCWTSLGGRVHHTLSRRGNRRWKGSVAGGSLVAHSPAGRTDRGRKHFDFWDSINSAVWLKSYDDANFVIASFLYVSGRYFRKYPRFLLHSSAFSADGPGNPVWCHEGPKTTRI